MEEEMIMIQIQEPHEQFKIKQFFFLLLSLREFTEKGVYDVILWDRDTEKALQDVFLKSILKTW